MEDIGVYIRGETRSRHGRVKEVGEDEYESEGEGEGEVNPAVARGRETKDCSEHYDVRIRKSIHLQSCAENC